MSNMIKFQQMLSVTSEVQNPYLQALRAFTKISPAQLIALTSDLYWQVW